MAAALVLIDPRIKQKPRQGVLMGLLSSRLLLSFAWLLICAQLLTPISAERKSYVVYMGGHHQGQNRISINHHDFLSSFVGSLQKAQEVIFYTYTKHINGFAAHLEEDEVAEISKSPMVLTVFPNKLHKLHTTHSWEFLGLEKNGDVPADSLWTKASFGKDIIIANLDSGVWPESASFNDEGLGPVPSRWKGICQSTPSNPILCNKKLIGARVFSNGYIAAEGKPRPGDTDTVRDIDGHGTHTLATAGGSPVAGASLFGFANGTAKGGAPGARVAAYKICFGSGAGGCFDADLLAAFDQAIEDKVDVLSVSVGGEASDYISEGIAIGSFHAVKNGITVVCSGGNSGPQWGTVSNVAPWILTVAASTMDRDFTAYAILGNGAKLQGQSLSVLSLPADQSYPLIFGSDAANANSSPESALACALNSLNPATVQGKIVVCVRGGVSDVEKGAAVYLAGGVGVIIVNDASRGYDVSAKPHVIPAVAISYKAGGVIVQYIQTSSNPVATITKPSTVLGTKPAPFMASFSSRGPNTIDPAILKPDITAPGVHVLAAYSEVAAVSGASFDNRQVKFNIISGTSMSCPHVAGIVALLKALHPDWSPAAIRSAIMTTATVRDNEANFILDSSASSATPFSYGAGHVRPNLATDPGLVYDLTPNDYIDFLCAIGYNSSQLQTFAQTTVVCPKSLSRLIDFNYPSITVPKLSASTTITRKLKNVGPPGTYTVQVIPPQNITVTVNPDTLVFSSIGQEAAFSVTFKVQTGVRVGIFGWLIWSDGFRRVQSPITVGFVA